MKKTIMVSNSWRPEKSEICSECGADIDYAWGNYTFRYFEQKDKSDLRVICKSCAADMKNKDNKIRVVNRSPLMDLISLKNSGWKAQPNRQGQGFSGFGGAEPDSADEKDADE